MNNEVIITCAVTGAGDTVGKHPAIPVTPKQISESAIEAAKAGAAIVHIHARDPETGKSSRDPMLFRETVARVRDSGVDVILNLTGGMGGDFVLGPDDAPMTGGPGTDMVGPLGRMTHVTELLPEIASLDCGTLNFGDGNSIYISTPNYLRIMAAKYLELGVKPELEVFELGHIRFAKQLMAEGLLTGVPLFQLCLGIPWGAPADSISMRAMMESLPSGSNWAAFGLGRMEMPMVAQAILLGGNVRVGLEDNLWLERGVPASNGALVDCAVRIATLMGASARAGRKPEEARSGLIATLLGVRRFGPAHRRPLFIPHHVAILASSSFAAYNAPDRPTDQK